MNFLKTKREAPALVPTDTIVPLHSNDDSKSSRACVFDVLFKFDDVLDPEKLHGSLRDLLAREGWRKLGARLRLNVIYVKDYLQRNTNLVIGKWQT
jgi:hypothetical protein